MDIVLYLWRLLITGIVPVAIIYVGLWSLAWALVERRLTDRRMRAFQRRVLSVRDDGARFAATVTALGLVAQRAAAGSPRSQTHGSFRSTTIGQIIPGQLALSILVIMAYTVFANFEQAGLLAPNTLGLRESSQRSDSAFAILYYSGIIVMWTMLVLKIFDAKFTIVFTVLYSLILYSTAIDSAITIIYITFLMAISRHTLAALSFCIIMLIAEIDTAIGESIHYSTYPILLAFAASGLAYILLEYKSKPVVPYDMITFGLTGLMLAMIGLTFVLIPDGTAMVNSAPVSNLYFLIALPLIACLVCPLIYKAYRTIVLPMIRRSQPLIAVITAVWLSLAGTLSIALLWLAFVGLTRAQDGVHLLELTVMRSLTPGHHALATSIVGPMIVLAFLPCVCLALCWCFSARPVRDQARRWLAYRLRTHSPSDPQFRKTTAKIIGHGLALAVLVGLAMIAGLVAAISDALLASIVPFGRVLAIM